MLILWRVTVQVNVALIDMQVFHQVLRIFEFTLRGRGAWKLQKFELTLWEGESCKFQKLNVLKDYLERIASLRS